MMKIKIGFRILILLFFTACTDKIKKEYYKSGKLKAEYESVDNKKHGHFKNYHENGQLDWEADYIMDTLNGLFKDYSEEGTLISEGYFKNGKQNDISKFYYSNGNLKAEQLWKDGKKDGYFKEYSNDGRLKFYALFESDSVDYYEKYNDSSQLIDIHRRIKIISNNDTVVNGEEFTGQIIVYGPYQENVNLTVALMPYGVFKEKIKYRDIPVKNGVVNYVLKSYRPGTFFIDATTEDHRLETNLNQKTKDVFVTEN